MKQITLIKMHIYLFYIILLPLNTSAFAASSETEEWFHRTDIELYRAIDENAWSADIKHSSGPDFHKLMVEAEFDYEADTIEHGNTGIYYGRPFGRYGLWKTGINCISEPANQWRITAGLEYHLPYFIETETLIHYAGTNTTVELELEREFVLTPALSVAIAIDALWSSESQHPQHISNNWNYWQPEIRLAWRHSIHVTSFIQWQQQRLLNDSRRDASAGNESLEHDAVTIGVELMF